MLGICRFLGEEASQICTSRLSVSASENQITLAQDKQSIGGKRP